MAELQAQTTGAATTPVRSLKFISIVDLICTHNRIDTICTHKHPSFRLSWLCERPLGASWSNLSLLNTSHVMILYDLAWHPINIRTVYIPAVAFLQIIWDLCFAVEFSMFSDLFTCSVITLLYLSCFWNKNVLVRRSINLHSLQVDISHILEVDRVATKMYYCRPYKLRDLTTSCMNTKIWSSTIIWTVM